MEQFMKLNQKAIISCAIVICAFKNSFHTFTKFFQKIGLNQKIYVFSNISVSCLLPTWLMTLCL